LIVVVMVALRDYQNEGVEKIRACFRSGVLRVLYQSPTGSGKTVLFSFVVANAVARGNRVGILGHRDELVQQISQAGDYTLDQLAARMSDGAIISSAVDEYTRLCPGVPALVFAVDIHHSQIVASAFTARGYRATHVDGETPREERRALIAALGTGELQVLCNCGLISEGLDVPSLTAVILLRPTRSLALYLQMVGRALRPAPGKERALILDHAGNSFRFGPVDAPRNWSLEGRAAADGVEPVRRCDACGAINPISALECLERGVQLRECTAHKTASPRSYIDISGGPLTEVTLSERLAEMSYSQCMRWAGAEESRLHLVATARGYKRGWVWHRLQELGGTRHEEARHHL
jgi:DNA repair protein RadD